MDLNEKFAKALEDTLNFKGVTVYNKNLQSIVRLDKEDDNFEVGIHCSAVDGNSFLYLICDMIKNGEVELKFKENNETVAKYIEYLKNLDV